MKRLTLSPADCKRLEESLSVLLSPLEYDRLDDWRLAVNRSVRRLLQSDLATFHLSHERTSVPLLSEEISATALQKYPAHLQHWNDRLGMVDRMSAMGVWTRTFLWGKRIDLLYASDYWSELLVPQRAYHSMGATVGVAEGQTPATLYLIRTNMSDDPCMENTCRTAWRQRTCTCLA